MNPIPGGEGARLGWRVWRVREEEDGTYLASTHTPDVWHPGLWLPYKARVATCHALHAAPHDRHPCGLHIFHEKEAAQSYLQECWSNRGVWSITDPFVMGSVAYWGELLVHDTGTRAQFAYPQELIEAKGVADPVLTLKVLMIKYGCQPGDQVQMAA
jgi:hypothetical protein